MNQPLAALSCSQRRKVTTCSSVRWWVNCEVMMKSNFCAGL